MRTGRKANHRVVAIALSAIFSSFVVATVIAQEVQTTTLPFKGVMAKDGEVELILRLYDRDHGGTKLFEDTALVDVSNGVYVAYADVPSAILARYPTVWMEAARATAPSAAIGARTPFAMKRSGEVQQEAFCSGAGCASLCFTCGGEFTIYAGTIPLPSGSMPTERGAACSGALTSMADTAPFLCTK
jgi:hypothetical protein